MVLATRSFHPIVVSICNALKVHPVILEVAVFNVAPPRNNEKQRDNAIDNAGAQ